MEIENGIMLISGWLTTRFMMHEYLHQIYCTVFLLHYCKCRSHLINNVLLIPAIIIFVEANNIIILETYVD